MGHFNGYYYRNIQNILNAVSQEKVFCGGINNARHYKLQLEDSLQRTEPANLIEINRILQFPLKSLNIPAKKQRLNLGIRTKSFKKTADAEIIRGTGVDTIIGEDAEERANFIGMILLASFVIKNIPLIRKNFLLYQLQKLNRNELSRYFIASFPLVYKANNRDLWGVGKFTDPKTHSEGKFCYIVHAMEELGFGSTQNRNAMLQNPNGVIQSLSGISCSVIDQNHRATFSSYGLILRVPKENILTAHKQDQEFPYTFSNLSGSKNLKEAAELTQIIRDKDAEFGGLATPQEMLVGKSGQRFVEHNEVVILGSSSGGDKKTEVNGFFIKTRNGRPDWETNHNFHSQQNNYQELLTMLGRASQRLSVPIIHIREW